jgi:outer membrane immunogenic protein
LGSFRSEIDSRVERAAWLVEPSEIFAVMSLLVAPVWLLGLEADLSSGAASNTNGVPGTDSSRVMTAQEKLDWFGTVRGRIGVLPSDRFLAYVTGGLAYGHGSLSSALSRTTGCAGNNCEAGSVSDTKAGWTLGGGVEWAFASNWSMKAEYLYVDLGSLSHNIFDRPDRFCPPVHLCFAPTADLKPGRSEFRPY